MLMAGVAFPFGTCLAWGDPVLGSMGSMVGLTVNSKRVYTKGDLPGLLPPVAKTYRWPTGTWKMLNTDDHHQGNATQNHKVVRPLHLSEQLASKKTTNSKWRECGEKRTLLHCCGTVNWYSHCGEQHEGSSKRWPVQVRRMKPGTQGQCSWTTQGGEVGGRVFRMGGEHMYTWGWFMLMYGKNHHGIVK